MDDAMLESDALQEDFTMASFADKPILDVTIAEWTDYLENEPSPDGSTAKWHASTTTTRCKPSPRAARTALGHK